MTMKTVKPVDKLALASAVHRFTLGKPCFDPNDYHTRSAYRSDYNSYKKDADYNRKFSAHLLNEILLPLDDQTIIQNVYSRLEIEELPLDSKIIGAAFNGYRVSYTAGQYYCTEYQWGARQTIMSWINAHLVAVGLPLKELLALPTLSTNEGKLGELKFYDGEKYICLKIEDGEYLQTVQKTFAGVTHTRTFYMGAVGE